MRPLVKQTALLIVLALLVATLPLASAPVHGAHLTCFILTGTGMIFGTVTDAATGKPIEGASVSVYDDGGQLVASASTQPARPLPDEYCAAAGRVPC